MDDNGGVLHVCACSLKGKLALEEDEELNYHDFMSVMLGRKRQKVYLLPLG